MREYLNLITSQHRQQPDFIRICPAKPEMSGDVRILLFDRKAPGRPGSRFEVTRRDGGTVNGAVITEKDEIITASMADITVEVSA